MFAVNQFKSLINHALTNNFSLTQVCHKSVLNIPRKRNPFWFLRKRLPNNHDKGLTKDSKKFINEIVHDKYGEPVEKYGLKTYENASSLLKSEVLPPVKWSPGLRRTGLVARKLGYYQLWLKNGKTIDTTVLQIADNHVVKYIPPQFFNPKQKKPLMNYSRYGCLLIGSEAVDPNTLTANYAGLFKGSGVMPKKNLSRFIISPQAAILPGTQLNVTHFKIGDYVDVRGKTIDRGFQGVMKRHGFKGQPASHGATKTHRRPGSIGGGIKHRVWPGKKMPGHMGNRYRISKACKIWRINTKTNTLWVSGNAIPGNPNSLVYIYDSILPLRRPKEPHFPTFTGDESSLPEDIYEETVHRFGDPTIFYEPEN